MTAFAIALKRLVKSEMPAVVVTVVTAKGSTPRNAGTVMAVTRMDHFGTIGGGQLEWMAIDHARRFLAGKSNDRRMALPLGPEIGQCCGGQVELAFEFLTTQNANAIVDAGELACAVAPHVLIFGAGHTGRALAEALKRLPLVTTLIDTRTEELARAPQDVRTVLTALPEAEVRSAPAGSAFVVLTHDHALDFLITREALMRVDAAYVGLIGSRTKRVSFERWARSEGGGAPDCGRLTSPIGGKTVRDKRPEVIAALTAAEILTALIGKQSNSETHKSGLGAHHEYFTTAS